MIEIVLASSLVTGLAVACRKWLERRKLPGPSVPLERAKEGQLVHIRGRVVCNETTEAPFSGMPSVIYKLRLSRGAVTHDEKASCSFFVVTDSGDPVLIEVESPAELHLKLRYSWRQPFAPARGHIKMELKKRSWPTAVGSSIKVDEFRLEEGDEVVVIGEAAWKSAPEGQAGYRGAPERLRIVTPKEGALFVSNLEQHLERFRTCDASS